MNLLPRPCLTATLSPLGERCAVSKVVAFERWLKENGGSFKRLEIRKYDTEVRGVHAREDIEADEVIVEIPRK